MDAYKEVKQAATARKAQNATVSNATDEEVAEANAAVDAAQTEGLHYIQVVKSQQEVADTKAKVLDKINAIQTQSRVKPAADTEVKTTHIIHVNKKSKIAMLQLQKKKKRHIRN